MFITFDPASRNPARRFRRNLAALSDLFPDVLARVVEAMRQPLPLLADPASPETPVDIVLDGRPLHATDSRVLAAEHVVAFAQANQSFTPGIALYSAEDEVAYERVRALEDAFGAKVISEPKPYAVPQRYAPILTVFGVGLGFHIESLLERHDVLHLVLYEADPHLFSASLHAIDWERIIERFRGAGRSVTIIVEPDAEKAVSDIFAALQRPSPALTVGSRYFRLYRSPKMDAVADTVSKYLPLIGYGWGYFKDERRQILQTWRNLEQPHRWIRRRWAALPGASAVVVGAGPSLDATLPLLRQIRDRVVVFSGGTALRPLAAAGIEPDFHVELETAPTTPEFLATLPDQGLFERITLLVSNGMAPSALSMFHTTRVFGRDNSVSSDLMGDAAEPVRGCYPVVSNAGVGIAVALGFRHITLLGVDFGYRDPARHHAAGTIYMDEETGQAKPDLSHIGLGHVALLDFGDIRKRLPSTRGDDILAESTLHMSHVAMETFLASMPDLTLIQCGEGASVPRAVNLVPEAFDPSIYRSDRKALLAALADRFEAPPMSAGDYGKRMESLAGAMDRLTRRLKRQFSPPQKTVIDLVRRFDVAMTLTTRAATEAPGLRGLLHGIFTSYFKATVERSFMIEAADEQRRFLALAQQHFIALLDDINAAVEPLRAAVRS